MSKLNKFRRSPQLFFADAKSPLTRRLGVGLTNMLVDKYGLDKLLYDPLQAAANSEFPLLADLAKETQERARVRRQHIIEGGDSPLVSMIVPAHNAAQTIEAAVESLQTQTYKNIEIIVVDDRSTDETASLVRSIAARDSRVRLCPGQSRGGAALARNIGMQAARGEFVSFQDADDRSTKDRVERQLAVLLVHPRAMLSVCDYRREDASGQPIAINGRVVARSIISMMFRREPILSRVGYMRDLRVSEDAEYYERIKLLYGDRCERHIFKILYIARFDPSSLLFSDGKTRVEESGGVSHARSERAEAELLEMCAWHQRIRKHAASAYVNVQGETA